MADASRLWCRLRTSQYFCLCVCCANLKQTDVCVHCATLHRPPPGWIAPFFTLSFLFVFSLCANKNETMRPGGVGIVVVVVVGGCLFSTVSVKWPRGPRPLLNWKLKSQHSPAQSRLPPFPLSEVLGFHQSMNDGAADSDILGSQSSFHLDNRWENLQGKALGCSLNPLTIPEWISIGNYIYLLEKIPLSLCPQKGTFIKR